MKASGRDRPTSRAAIAWKSLVGAPSSISSIVRRYCQSCAPRRDVGFARAIDDLRFRPELLSLGPIAQDPERLLARGSAAEKPVVEPIPWKANLGYVSSDDRLDPRESRYDHRPIDEAARPYSSNGLPWLTRDVSQVNVDQDVHGRTASQPQTTLAISEYSWRASCPPRSSEAA